MHTTTQFQLLVVVVAGLLWPAAARSSELAIGILSWDVLIPGSPSSPGVNTFTIGNLTGDPATGGNEVPPTFPVVTSLTFQNSSLVLISGGSSQTVGLGDLSPGFFSPNALQFIETASFSSAMFSAVLDTTVLRLDGGGLFAASSVSVSALLLPSGGGDLVAGNDLVLITVSDAAAPEPASFLLLATGLLWCWPWRGRHRDKLLSIESR